MSRNYAGSYEYDYYYIFLRNMLESGNANILIPKISQLLSKIEYYYVLERSMYGIFSTINNNNINEISELLSICLNHAISKYSRHDMVFNRNSSFHPSKDQMEMIKHVIKTYDNENGTYDFNFTFHDGEVLKIKLLLNVCSFPGLLKNRILLNSRLSKG